MIRLLLIGNPAGMESVATAARERAGQVREVQGIRDALDAVPDVTFVILFQHWPDEYPAEEIHQLLNVAPLVRLMVCQGPWCASFGRTRQSWPAAVCVEETRWLSRLEKEFSVLSGQRSPLPWTAGLDEVFAFDQSACGSDRSRSDIPVEN